MNVNQIAEFCTQTIGDTSDDMVEYAKTAIRLKYQTLYDAHAWRESLRIYDIVLDPALNGSLFLPYDAEEVVYLKLSRDGVNYVRLQYRERDWIERFASTQYSLPGYIPLYYRSENLAWPYIGPQNITFSTQDQTPFTVFIEGKDLSGQSVTESFILQSSLMPDGITIVAGTVTTKNQYKTVHSLSKDGGTLTVHDSVSGISVTASAERSNLIFSQFVLYPSLTWTDSSGLPIPYTVQTQVKLKPDALDNDMSVPRISHIWDALVEFTLSSLYTRARQLTKADAREQKAIAHIQAAVNIEKNQSEMRQQVVPTMYESGDYLGHYGHYLTSAYPFGG